MFPAILLEAKPDSLEAFLNLTVDDTTFRLDQEDNQVYFHSGAISTSHGTEMSSAVDLIGIPLRYLVTYAHNASSRNEVLATIISEPSELAQGERELDVLVLTEFGFLFEIQELEFPQGPGVGYSSAFIPQPEASYFNIQNYFSGTFDTIWLQGTFSVVINGGIYGGQTLTGEFFMQFPVLF